MCEAVCFDLDGTLFDDRQYARAGLLAAAEVLEHKTGVDASAELLRAYFQNGVREQTFDTVLESKGLSEDLVPALVEAYHSNEADLVPYPDAEATLSQLTQQYPIGVVTGGKNGVSKLDRLNLREYVDTVVVASDLGSSKREPEPFEHLLESLGVRADQSVLVGDRPEIDFAVPNRLGMITIRVTRGQYAEVPAVGDARPDHVADTLRSAADCIRECSGASASPNDT